MSLRLWISHALPFFCVSVILALLSGTPAQGQGAPFAEYAVRFDSAWSADDHPTDFPGSAHFSGLIGGTHDDGVSFWQPGELASAGIKRMAETGGKSPLNTEVAAAITAGTAGEVISGTGVGSSPGVAVASFTATSDYPLVTLVSMIAPSPDWFVGVHGLSLRDGGEWAHQVIVELQAYDAGTDDGATFRSPNAPLPSPVPIARILVEPFPDAVPLGTFTFTRIQPQTEHEFLRGDPNEDAVQDISDAIFILSALFQAGSVPACEKSVDVNDDDEWDISDAIFLLGYLFSGGPEPPSPGLECGTDPTADELTCEAHLPCEG